MDELTKLIEDIYKYAEETHGYRPALIRVTPEYRQRLVACVDYAVYQPITAAPKDETIYGVPVQVVDNLEVDYEFIGVGR